MAEDFSDTDFAAQFYTGRTDPGVVLDSVIWPLVDFYWRDDWQLSSHPDNKIHFEKKARIESRLFRVALNAETSCVYEADDEVVPVHEVGLHIEEVLEKGTERGLIFSELVMRNPDILHVVDDPGLFSVLRGVTYQFDQERNLSIDHYRTILDRDGDTVVDGDGRLMPKYRGDDDQLDLLNGMLDPDRISDDIDDDAVDTEADLAFSSDLLLEHDIELIKCGLCVFKAPQAIMDSINSLRALSQ